jgi:hypothetical protein
MLQPVEARIAGLLELDLSDERRSTPREAASDTHRLG